MRSFRDLNLRRKLLALLLLSSGVAGVAAGAILGVYDAMSLRHQTVHELTTLAEIVGQNGAAALASGNRAAASQVLSTLSANAGILAVGAYSKDGQILAEYYRSNGADPVPRQVLQGQREVSNLHSLGLIHPVSRDGKVVGAIYLQSNWDEFYLLVARDGLMALLALLAAALAILPVWLRSIRLIADPITDLLRDACAASGEEGTAILVSSECKDEVSLLRACIKKILFRLSAHDNPSPQYVEELQRQNQQLMAAKTEAVQARRAQAEFLANMSHEIRTPMNSIMGMTEMALDSDTDPTRREYLGLVKSSAESLLTVINDILDVSKMEAGKLDVDEVEFHLRGCLGNTVKTLALRAHEKELELLLRVQPEVPDCVLGDPSRLRQILFNLVGNSIKFTDCGEVSVQVNMESSDAEQAILHFAVTDTGIGIPLEKRRVIFEAFSQADQSIGRRFGGTGLGLTITSRLVAMMGGRMWVESEEGKGSTFHFTLKVLRAKQSAAAGPLPKPAILKDVSVLVVDDNSTNRQMLNELLAHWGMKPTLAENGVAGLRVLEGSNVRGEDFPLILLDSRMPDMDGFTFAKRVKADPRFAGSVIMMLTSGGQRGDANLCRELRISAYLVKPIQQAELIEAILTVLGHKPDSPHQSSDLITRHSLREDRRHQRILLAEDNPVNQTVAVRLLEKMGHTVMVVANGRDAVLMAQEQEFDLVLMDVQMPEMGGFEATRAIRAKELGSEKHLPIIAMTAHAMKGDREKCLAVGMDGYIAKPIRVPELVAEIERFGRHQEPTPQKPPPPAQGECIDWQAAWANLEGDRNLLSELALLFLGDLPKQMEAIRLAVGKKQGHDLERLAHRLKGSVGNFAANPAFQAALRLEQTARQGDFEQIPAAMESFECEIRRLESALQQWAQKPPEGDDSIASHCTPPPAGTPGIATDQPRA